jgi:two-component system osmolarity sensor histidine kinase EnvZ
MDRVGKQTVLKYQTQQLGLCMGILGDSDSQKTQRTEAGVSSSAIVTTNSTVRQARILFARRAMAFYPDDLGLPRHKVAEFMGVPLMPLKNQGIRPLPDPAAMARAEEIGAALELEVILPSDDAPDADRRAFIDWSGREVILTLRSRMPELIAVDLVSGNAQVWAWFQTQHGVMRVALERRRMSASNPHQLLVLMVFTSILMTGVAYIFLRNQLTPIARMAQAAEAFGKGEIMPFRPRGATEVRAAGQAFLDMRLRIERQIEARTQMLSGVSHDLRTPLTRLKLGLSFLPEDEEVEALKRDVQQMERMVDEFLAFARGDAMEAAEEVDPTALLVLVVADAVRAGQAVRLGAMDWPGGTMRLRPQAVRRAL